MKKIFIDANALILFVLGNVNSNYIGRHKRLSIYTQRDFDYLETLIRNGQSIVTSPNVWTEVDNLCHDSITGDDKFIYVKLMRRIHNEWVFSFEETYVKTSEAVKMQQYSQIGLSDTIALMLSHHCDLLITGDSELTVLAIANGIKVFDMKADVTQRALLY